MISVKIPTSNSYHQYLIESLKDREEVAGYIEVVLEEGNDDPHLLPKVLKNVIEAYEKNNQLSDHTLETYEKLMPILRQDNCREIYLLIELLKALGLEININVQ